MSSFIKTIDTSSTPSSSNILVSAVLNEINDRNNAITIAIQKEMTLRDNAITQQVSTLPSRTDITSMIGNSISTFNTTLLASNSFTTAQQVSSMIGNSVNNFNTTLSAATNGFITAVQANNMIVAYNYLTSSQITTLIGTFGYQSLTQIQNLGYQTLNNVTALGYQTASNVKDIVNNYGYTTMAQIVALNYQSLTQINTLITNAGYGVQNTILAATNKFTGFNTFNVIQVNAIQLIGTFSSVILGQNSNGGSFATAIGTNALTSSNTQYNTGVGYNALTNTTQYNNTGIGAQCLLNNITGTNNSALGMNSGTNNTSGSNNTYLGTNSSTTMNNCIGSTGIGYGSVVTASNQIMMGTLNETVVIPGNLTLNNVLKLPTNYALTYTSLPTFASNQVGFQVISNTAKRYVLKLGSTNTEQIILPVGIWQLNFRFDIYNNTNVSCSGWFNYGISTDGFTGLTQYNQTTFNISPNLTFSIANSCMLNSTPVIGNQLYYMTLIMPPELATPTNYTAYGSMIATRLA